ncbi:hypothetical protein [uncultured Mesonia sp.]|uniref:hypothetical protein n=1 Tax=uncultured Mesonia sp. TaxID=399731 RepID=UPI00374E264D
MEEISNFIIDYKKENFAKDYASYLKNKFREALKKLIGGLVISIVIFLLIRELADWKVLESILVGLIVLITTFIFFKTFDLLTVKNNLKKGISQVSFGKMNLIIEPTFIELNQYGRKKVIFLSQLTKCILINDVIFFVEKSKKFLPVKVNKVEMKNGSFEQMISKINKLRIRIEK